MVSKIKETKPLLHLHLQQHLERVLIVLKVLLLVMDEVHHLHLLRHGDPKQILLESQHHQESLHHPGAPLPPGLQPHRHSQMLENLRIPMIEHLLEHMLLLIQGHPHHLGLRKRLSKITNQENQVRDLEFLLLSRGQELRHHPLHNEVLFHLRLLEIFINHTVVMLYRLRTFLLRLYRPKLQHLQVLPPYHLLLLVLYLYPREILHHLHLLCLK